MSSLTYDQAKALHGSGVSLAQIGRMYGISRSAVYQKLHPEKVKMRECTPSVEAQKRYREKNAQKIRERRRHRYAHQVITSGKKYSPRIKQMVAAE